MIRMQLNQGRAFVIELLLSGYPEWRMSASETLTGLSTLLQKNVKPAFMPIPSLGLSSAWRAWGQGLGPVYTNM